MSIYSNGIYFEFHPTRDYGTLTISGGREIAFQLVGATSPDVLVICFHGATDRQKVTLPRFQQAFDAGARAAYLSISDPTILENDNLRLGWYSGSESFPLRSILEELLLNTIAVLGPRRTLFFGSSGGGYAALLYARSVEGSVSLTVNPQTDILSYYSSHVNEYFATCWPRVTEAERASGPLICDMAALYKDNPGKVSTVMLSSAGDRQHFVNHVSRFVGLVGLPTKSRLILASDFFGTMGHGGSIPSTVVRRWYNAALISETAEPESILMAYHAQAPETVQQLLATPKNARSGQLTNPSDVHLADLLRDYHLRQTIEG